ncbi:MAG: hypothetical protein ACJLUP_21115 [Agrobacterium tumefaciens]
MDGTLTATAEANTSTDDLFRLEPNIADLAGHPEQYALLAAAAIRQQGCRHVIGKIMEPQRCPAGGTTLHRSKLF